MGGATAVLGGIAGCITTSRDAEATMTETLDVDEASGLTVEGAVGDVTVRGESRDDVRVEGTKRAGGEDGLERVEVRTERTGRTLSVAVDRTEEDGLLQLSPTPLVDLHVRVPKAFRVSEAVVDTGDLSVDGVTGPLRAETDTGDLEATAVDGDLTARSDTGDQRIDGVTGRLNATVNTGEVTATGAAALGDVATDTGNLDVTAARLDGDATVAADTGDVALRFEEPLDAEVTVSTETGDIDVEHLGDVDRTETEGSFEATVGDGTHSLSVSTDTGDVTLSGGS